MLCEYFRSKLRRESDGQRERERGSFAVVAAYLSPAPIIGDCRGALINSSDELEFGARSLSFPNPRGMARYPAREQGRLCEDDDDMLLVLRDSRGAGGRLVAPSPVPPLKFCPRHERGCAGVDRVGVQQRRFFGLACAARVRRDARMLETPLPAERAGRYTLNILQSTLSIGLNLC